MEKLAIIATIIAVVTLFFSLIEPIAGAKPSKISQLVEMQESANIIKLDSKGYEKYVLKEPRDYDIMMYYTMPNKCEHCDQMESELEQVAFSYIQAGMHKIKPSAEKKPIFFAKLDFNPSNQHHFINSDFQSVPVLCLATKELAETYKNTGKSVYAPNLEWKISSQDFYDASKVLEHINNITNNNVELQYTLMQNLKGFVLIFVICSILFASRNYIRFLLMKQWFWIVLTVIAYVYCVGGTAFNWIHKVPNFKYAYDEAGTLYVEEYFQISQRSQYAGEGYMASTMMLVIGVTLIVYTYIDKVKNPFMKELY